MKIEIEDDYVHDIVVNRLVEDIEELDENLEMYKTPDHRLISMFSTDENEDISKIRELRTAIALVLSDWYGKYVEPLEPLERSVDITGTCAVELIKENADGSADYAFDFTEEQVRAFTRLGIMAAIQAGLDKAKNLDPDSGDNQLNLFDEGDNILALAEEAGFCMWGNESHKPEGATIDWSCDYDEELVKFYRLARQGVKA